MLDHSSGLEQQVNFAVDILGLATKYEMMVLRWGNVPSHTCLVNVDRGAEHHNWLAVDIELESDDEAEKFATDAVIAGLFVERRGLILHVSPSPSLQIPIDVETVS